MSERSEAIASGGMLADMLLEAMAKWCRRSSPVDSKTLAVGLGAACGCVLGELEVPDRDEFVSHLCAALFAYAKVPLTVTRKK